MRRECKDGNQSTNMIRSEFVSILLKSAIEGALTETFTLIGGPIDKHLRANHVAERQEHLHQFRVAKLLRQMVDEEVATFRTGDRTA